MRLEWTNQTPRQDQQQQREKKKKKKGPQPGGSQPHRCKSSQDANRSRRKDPAATPLASKDHATSAASSANPARPRPSPRPPQSERVGPPVLSTFTFTFRTFSRRFYPKRNNNSICQKFEKRQYISALTITRLTHSPYTTEIARRRRYTRGVSPKCWVGWCSVLVHVYLLGDVVCCLMCTYRVV